MTRRPVVRPPARRARRRDAWLRCLGVGVLLTWSGLAIAQAPATCAPQQAPRNGKGVAVWSDCTRWEGEFIDGRLSGPGRQQWPNGERIEGTFFAGRLEGNGMRRWPDGRRYEGPFANGAPVGWGRMTMADGTVYEGLFFGTQLMGLGVRRSPNGEVLVGEWREDFTPFGDMLRILPDGKREKVAMNVTPPKPDPASTARPSSAPGAPPAAPSAASPPAPAPAAPPVAAPAPPAGGQVLEEAGRVFQGLRGIFGR